MITSNEPFTWLWRNSQNCLHSATLEGFPAWTSRFRPRQSVLTAFEPRLWLFHSKMFILLFLSRSDVSQTERSEACSFLSVVWGCSLPSWTGRRCARSVTLVGRSLLGRFSSIPRFVDNVDNPSHCGSLASQSFRNGFLTLSRLRDGSDLVSHLFFF